MCNSNCLWKINVVVSLQQWDYTLQLQSPRAAKLYQSITDLPSSIVWGFTIVIAPLLNIDETDELA